MSVAGKILLYGYHQPIGLIRDSWRHGGPIAQWHTRSKRQAMEGAAALLPPLPFTQGRETTTVHLLTGRRYWAQTAFCLHTLARACRSNLAAELYDDGTLDTDMREHLERLGACIRIHTRATLADRLDRELPSARFPHLRERYRSYPNLRKLVDIHAGGRGAKLVLDSDLLFFRHPQAMLDWLRAPSGILHATDCIESYGYSRPLLERLAGAPLPTRVNVGVCGLVSENLDWDLLECWTRELLRAEGTSYYLEQALVALLAARSTERVALPPEDYVTMPERSEVLQPTAVMHHYVDTSSRWYFGHAWQRFVSAS